jgi:hypothetical protein
MRTQGFTWDLRSFSGRQILLATAVTAIWATVGLAVHTGQVEIPHAPIIFEACGPALCALLVVLGRARGPLWLAALGIGAVSLAFIGERFSGDPAVALGVLAAVVIAPVCLRLPATAVLVAVLLTATFGSVRAFAGISVSPILDLILAGLWIGLASRILARRSQGVLMPAGAFLLLAFVVVTAVQILAAPSLSIGMQSFHTTAWYLLLFFLIAFADWDDATYDRIARGVVMIAVLVGGYAVLRMIIGPAPDEEVGALREAPNLIGESLGLFGSFFSRHQLAAWCGTVIPFLVLFGVTSRSRWRLIAYCAAVVCTIALFATGIRAGFIGAVIGLGALAFLPVSRSRSGIGIGTVALMVIGAITIGAIAFSVALQDPLGRGRYSAILTPSDDAAYNARIETWNRVLDDVEENPLGHGLGSAGGLQQNSGTTSTSLGSEAIDNSYLLIAYQQGVWVAALFIAGILGLLIGLIRRSVSCPDPRRAGLGLASAAGLASLVFILFTGDYVEGYNSVLGWVLAGLGVAQFVRMAPARVPETPAQTRGALSPAFAGDMRR